MSSDTRVNSGGSGTISLNAVCGWLLRGVTRNGSYVDRILFLEYLGTVRGSRDQMPIYLINTTSKSGTEPFVGHSMQDEIPRYGICGLPTMMDGPKYSSAYLIQLPKVDVEEFQAFSLLCLHYRDRSPTALPRSTASGLDSIGKL